MPENSESRTDRRNIRSDVLSASQDSASVLPRVVRRLSLAKIFLESMSQKNDA